MAVRLASDSGISSPVDCFSEEERAAFARDGYLIVRKLADNKFVEKLRAVALRDLHAEAQPVEYEADVHYPGAPESRSAEGGVTIRRLLQAHGRSPDLSAWISSPGVRLRLQQLLGPHVVMPLVHHNCIMTKHPRFSSDTGWHQDIRFWSFTQPELVSLWVALGDEHRENGCLQLLPGTHTLPVEPWRLDEGKFLRTDLPENQGWLDNRVSAELQSGDALFFHCRTFHAASRNYTAATKLSLVLTFRAGDNPPVAGTRSASLPELMLPQR